MLALMTARSKRASRPTSSAGKVVPLARVISSLFASATTWLFVRMWPWSSIMKPEPVPAGWGSERKPGCTTELMTVTTEGRELRYTWITVSYGLAPWALGAACAAGTAATLPDVRSICETGCRAAGEGAWAMGVVGEGAWATGADGECA